jgi:hypothetical protein
VTASSALFVAIASAGARGLGESPLLAGYRPAQSWRTPSPSNLLLVMLPVLVIAGHMRGYRPPRSSWSAIIFAGVSIFLVTVTDEHLHDTGLTPWQFRTEPWGFLVSLACLGHVLQ